MPIVNDNICGSVLLTENAHVDPGEVMRSLQEYLQNAGVEFLYNEEVVDFEFKKTLLMALSRIKKKSKQKQLF